MAKKPAVHFSSDFRFVEGGITCAILEQNAKLTLKEGNSSLEVFESWRDFVRDSLGETPTTSPDETDILNQLGTVLGVWEPIDRTVSDKKRPAPTTNQGENEMATVKAVAKKAVPAAKKEKTPRAKKEKVESACKCGCGGVTFAAFCPGHDARYHGWAKKIARGDMKFSEVPPAAAKALKAEGVVQGIKAAA